MKMLDSKVLTFWSMVEESNGLLCFQISLHKIL